MSDFPAKWQSYVDHEREARSKINYLETPHLNQFFIQELSKKKDVEKEFLTNYAGLSIAYEKSQNNKNHREFR